MPREVHVIYPINGKLNTTEKFASLDELINGLYTVAAKAHNMDTHDDAEADHFIMFITMTLSHLVEKVRDLDKQLSHDKAMKILHRLQSGENIFDIAKDEQLCLTTISSIADAYHHPREAARDDYIGQSAYIYHQQTGETQCV